MTEQTSRLAIIVDSSGAEKNADNLATALVRMTQAGEKAERATDDLSGSTKQLNSWMRAGSTDAKKSTESINEQRQAFEALRNKIDPIGAAINEVGRRFSEVKKYFDSGLIDKEEFLFLKQKLDETTEELSGVAQAQREAEKAGKLAAAQLETQARAFETMLAKIDPLTSALKNLDQQQHSLSEALKNGKINTEQFDRYSQKLAETRREVTGEAQAERDAVKAHIVIILMASHPETG